MDTFRNSIFFDFFRISASFDLQGALVKKISKKISSKQIWTLLEMFFGILKIWDFFRFFEFFRLLDPPGCTGRNFSPEKIPRGMLKTCLNTFGNVFGHFEKMKVFQLFDFFPSLDLPGCTGQFFLRKLPQNKFETCLDTSKNVLDTFEKSNFFRFFYEFLQNSISRLHWGRKVRKKLPQASLDTFGKVFRDFGTLKSFRVLWIFFESPVCTGHSVFRRKTQLKHSQTMFLGTFSDNFEIFEVFPFFKVFSKPRPSKVHWRLFFETKLRQNRFRTCLDIIRDSFGHFRKNEILHFFQSFPHSTLQGALCKNFTEKNYLETCSKHVWLLLGTFFGHFEKLKVFPVFWSFSKFRLSRVHWEIFFWKKPPQNKFKTCLDTFRTVFGHF